MRFWSRAVVTSAAWRTVPERSVLAIDPDIDVLFASI
jgi:hypothetical protein